MNKELKVFAVTDDNTYLSTVYFSPSHFNIFILNTEARGEELLRLGRILVDLDGLLAVVGAQQPVHQVDGEGEHHRLVLLSADAVESLEGGK